jgi:hypothetical protein
MPVVSYKNKESTALDEMEHGLVEADLGGNVFKNAFLWGKERAMALEPY